MGHVLQQRVDNAWQPLAFFSKKLNPAQQKCNAYDRELLAVYEAVKHFRHMLEARHFIIFTDHKPNGQLHTIGEDLILPATKAITKNLFSEKHVNEVSTVI
jgi:hypothetical protein